MKSEHDILGRVNYSALYSNKKYTVHINVSDPATATAPGACSAPASTPSSPSLLSSPATLCPGACTRARCTSTPSVYRPCPGLFRDPDPCPVRCAASSPHASGTGSDSASASSCGAFCAASSMIFLPDSPIETHSSLSESSDHLRQHKNSIILHQSDVI